MCHRQCTVQDSIETSARGMISPVATPEESTITAVGAGDVEIAIPACAVSLAWIVSNSLACAVCGSCRQKRTYTAIHKNVSTATITNAAAAKKDT